MKNDASTETRLINRLTSASSRRTSYPSRRSPVRPGYRPVTTGTLTWCGDAAYVVRDPQRDTDRITDKDDFCPKFAENYNDVFDTDGCPDTMQTLLIFAAENIDAFWAAVFSQSQIRYLPPAEFVAHLSPVLGTAAATAVSHMAVGLTPRETIGSRSFSTA